jgi:uroporphyrinogen decarboxylase
VTTERLPSMNRRERVYAALRGESVDRVPVSFWGHDYLAENSAESLAEVTLRRAREFDWDFLKPQSRAQCFGEMWGLTYQPSTERVTRYTTTRYPLTNEEDLQRLQPADPRSGALSEQLEALDLVRAGAGPDTPIVWTVFSPVMVLEYLLPGGRAQVFEVVRSSAEAVTRGLDAITETLAGYARACLEHGADGLFFATNLADQGGLDAEECRRFQRPFDTRVLAAADGARFNIMHVCGAGARLEEFFDYPVAAFSWSVEPGNPGLREVHARTGRAVVGGLPKALETLTAAQVEGLAQAAIEEMDSRWLLLAPGCSIPPATPDAVLRSARRAVEMVRKS